MYVCKFLLSGGLLFHCLNSIFWKGGAFSFDEFIFFSINFFDG